MILVVDDDAAMTAFVRTTLESDGRAVRTCHAVPEAMEWLEGAEPDLIISDVVMGTLGGFEFRRLHQDRFPTRLTPFLFLSSLSDTEKIVEGLELGADDFLVKPVAPQLLRAKVRAHLRQKSRYAAATFQGDVASFPFIKVLQFCETKFLNGDVTVDAPGLSVRLGFAAGQVLQDGGSSDTVLEKLLDLREGRFTVRSAPVDFSEIAAASPARAPAAPSPAASSSVMGCLSGVRVGKRLFQVQSEFLAHPDPVAVSVVILDGRTLLKRVSDPLPGRTREEWQRAVQEQHRRVEAEVGERVQAAADKGTAASTPVRDAHVWIEEGLGRYLALDYVGALAAWEEAARLDPGNKGLEVNLRIVRKKLTDAAP
ncbi:MAG: response regulator [Deltaproteobacteria bacterium]|nr:response regulator [Deltaproteobacteria bacterium]